MEFAMEGRVNLGISGCSSTRIDGELGWFSWSPEVDWSAPVAGEDDFHDLIEAFLAHDFECHGFSKSPEMQDRSTSVSSVSSASRSSSPRSPEEDDDLGLRLVHLLMAAAEALTHESHELARVILARLTEMVTVGAAATSGIERLAGHFAGALEGIIKETTAVGRQQEETHRPGEWMEAFQLLQDMSPYVKFGHFTANQAIVEAAGGERRLHVVDYDIMEGVQWASLMQALVCRSDGQALPHLRITAVSRGGAACRRSPGTVMETGRRLASFAASVGLPFSFGQCRLDAGELFRPVAVKIVKGEVVVLNCVLHASHLGNRSAASVASFLGSAAALGARLVTVVEEESAGAGEEEEGEGEFVRLFMEELLRYSAMWDALEAGFPKQRKAREAVERLILGPMIARAVGRAYRRREHEGLWYGWSEWLSAVGFRRVGLSFFNLCQARLLLGLFNNGYHVEEDSRNKLVLCWKSCRLLSASAWASPPPEISPLPAASSFNV